ncbi:NAD(P)/FAD-dependent oxidoreductase [Nonomuraea typhae]|uniref:NAD(P)/FAD-dependent oxidoreductase n=1 Tax=Nonomuraea typhae TaxID=2603600 RepID=UPI0012F8A227|nr:FAD-dependent oxidoreductase [Nonomuraea typhae]
MTRAVVLGGGFAGVLAAHVLAKHADEVVVIERDHYPPGAVPRRGLPQSHHNHVLVTSGARALDALLPGVVDELLARGAHRHGLPGDALILTAEGWFRRLDTDAYLLSCSRALLDEMVRRRVAVPVREGSRALGLVGDAGAVRGVVVRRGDGAVESVEAEVVLDASGRRSKAPRWLAELGAGPIEEEVAASGLTYATRIYRPPAHLAAVPAIMIHPKGQPACGGTLFPIEDGRWIVTLTGTRGGEPPTDERGFMDFARSLRDPLIADLMAAATPLGGIRPYRDTANRRRFFERARLPAGFAVIGDAAVAVNPMYSHGMSVAAMTVLKLDHELTSRGTATEGLQAALAAEADDSWHMAVERTDQQVRLSPFEREIRTRLGRALLSSRDLAAEFFARHTLIPAGPRRGAALKQEVPPLTTEQAVAQYPHLSAWWSARDRPGEP